MSEAAADAGGRTEIEGAAAALGFRLHHVGVATNKLEETAAMLESLFGYRTISGPFADPVQRVSVSFLTLDHDDTIQVELVEPLTDDAPVRSILQKGGGTAYHLCLETADLDAALMHCKGLGCLIVSAPAPAVAFDGRRIAWMYTKTRQLIELVETPGAADGQTAGAASGEAGS